MKSKKIILTGGGTGGSVTPLLALVPRFQAEGLDVLWIGTRTGVEKKIVSDAKLPFYAIASGKFRRYFSIKNFTDPILIIIGFFQSLFLLLKLRADVVMSAGGFVSVPVVWAAWCLRIPITIHQQDIRPGLANRLMSVCASVITVTFEKSLQDYKQKAVWVGNPVRPEFIKALESGLKKQTALPWLLILGGGTGSEALNELVLASLPTLTKQFYVIHITGNKISEKDFSSIYNYEPHSFLPAEKIAETMRQATLVITRAGLGTLTELSFLSKPTIIMPLPHSHQVDNAAYFQKNEAAIVLSQTDCSVEKFIQTIISMTEDAALLEKLSLSINRLIKPEAEKQIFTIVHDLIRR